MKIKICGITNIQDALDSAALGADALGFIFSETSPRNVKPDTAKAIINQLPPFVSSVGVFVNEDIEKVQSIADFCKLDIVQLHGEESPQYCSQIKHKIIKAIRIIGLEDLSIIEKYKECTKGILLDTYVKGTPGGTGQTFDWGLANKAKEYGHPVIVAGGIAPINVKKAILTANPYGIDISSGIEASPGKKDYQKMLQLFEALEK